MVGLMFSLTACGGKDVPTYETIQSSLISVQRTKIDQAINSFANATAVDALEASEKTAFQSYLTGVALNARNSAEALSDPKQLLETTYQTVSGQHPTLVVDDSIVETSYNEIVESLIAEAKVQNADFLNRHEVSDYHLELVTKVLNDYENKLGTSVTTIQKANSVSETVVESTDLYQIVKNYTIDFGVKSTEQEGLRWYSIKEGPIDYLFNNGLVVPIAFLMKLFSFGGYYIIGLMLVTILIRTLMWPVYAKSNDMSTKMSLMKPDMEALEAKYSGRTDETSTRYKQMEQMQLYKKYKIGIGGCLMPFLQFPAFMAIFRAISKMPNTDGRVSTALDWNKSLNSKIFGIDLFQGRGTFGDNKVQFIAIIIIMLIVVGTQILQQWYTQKRQAVVQEKSQEDVPAYKRVAVNQKQDQTQKTMKYMMYVMVGMMAVFVWTSPAGLGIYWCIGNLYSLGQMFLNNRLADTRREKLKQKLSK